MEASAELKIPLGMLGMSKMSSFSDRLAKQYKSPQRFASSLDSTVLEMETLVCNGRDILKNCRVTCLEKIPVTLRLVGHVLSWTAC